MKFVQYLALLSVLLSPFHLMGNIEQRSPNSDFIIRRASEASSFLILPPEGRSLIVVLPPTTPSIVTQVPPSSLYTITTEFTPNEEDLAWIIISHTIEAKIAIVDCIIVKKNANADFAPKSALDLLQENIDVASRTIEQINEALSELGRKAVEQDAAANP